eukprot:13572501-Alexandrium_andersonii.AAC.1
MHCWPDELWLAPHCMSWNAGCLGSRGRQRTARAHRVRAAVYDVLQEHVVAARRAVVGDTLHEQAVAAQ